MQTPETTSCSTLIPGTCDNPWEMDTLRELKPLDKFVRNNRYAAHMELQDNNMNEQVYDVNEKIQDNNWFWQDKVSARIYTP